MKTLLADDDVTSRLVLSTLLKKWGYEPEMVENGRQAWELLQELDAPKLILLDWAMPEMDGLEVIQNVRRLGGSAQPYIILLTARNEKGDLVRGLASGADDYVLKPYDFDELRARLEVGRRTVELITKAIQSQKMAGLGTLASGIAHEINTPLQVIISASEDILASVKEAQADRETIAREAKRINQVGWRIAKIVRSLQEYARSSPAQFAAASLNALVHDALLLMGSQISAWNNIEVVTELADNLPDLICDRNKIIQVLLNLLGNAHDAMPTGGALTIRTGFEEQDQRLYLSVSDSGAGIPEDLQARIFDPFFTTKPVGQGAGLGLSIAQGIMRSHGGEISITSRPGQGSAFTLFFPLNVSERKRSPTMPGGRYEE